MSDKKVKTNLIYNMLYQILILIVPFITTPYVSRILNPTGIGSYSVTTAITKYFVLFALLGMSNYGNRMIAKSKINNEKLSFTFWSLWKFQLSTCFIAILVYIIYILFFGYKKYNIIILCQIPYMLSCIFDVSWFFYGMEEFKLMVKRNTIIKLLTMIMIFLFVKKSDDVWIYTLINSLNFFFGQVILWPKLLKCIDYKKTKILEIKKHLKPNMILFVSVLAVSVYTLMDKIMIEHFSTLEEVGFYENTEKIFNIAIGLVGAIGAVMLPRVSSLVEEKNDKKVNIYIKKSLKYIMIFSIAIFFGIFTISEPFSLLFFGNKFKKCGLLLKIISPAIIFYSWSNILRTQYLLPKEKDIVFVKGTIYAAIVNLILNLILIPLYGALGAMIGTVGAQFSESFYQTLKIRKELKLKHELFNLFPYVIFGILMYLCCNYMSTLIKNQFVLLFAQIFIGCLIYIIITILHLYYKKDPLIYEFLKGVKKNEKTNK